MVPATKKEAAVRVHQNIQAKIVIMTTRKAGLVMTMMIILGVQLFLEEIITMLQKSCNSSATKCQRVLQI